MSRDVFHNSRLASEARAAGFDEAIRIAEEYLAETEARLRWAPSARAQIFGQGSAQTARNIAQALKRARDSDEHRNGEDPEGLSAK